MTSENVSGSEAVESAAAASAKTVDDQLIDEVVGRAQAESLQLFLREQSSERVLAIQRDPGHA
ncbi:transposase [Streptomyces sp. DT193]|uniref:transposase n=1 Tax=Streptomyces sp. DT193 TaxID=3393418 RepID=UPI003CF43DFC